MGKTVIGADDIRARLRSELQSLEERLAKKSEISSEDWARLANLERMRALLLAERELANRQLGVRVTFVGALLAAALVCLAATMRISTTAIDLLVTTDVARFALASTDPALVSLTEGPIQVGHVIATADQITGGCSPSATNPEYFGQNGGFVSLGSPEAPSGTEVTVRALGDHLRLSIFPKTRRFEEAVTLIGDIAVTEGGKPVECAAREITLRASPNGGVELEPFVQTVSFWPQLPVSGIELHEKLASGGAAEVLSGIKSGTLYIDTLAGKKYDLRPRQLLRLEGATGNILELSAKPRLNLRFSGSVKRIRFGSEQTDITPTVLDWLETHVKHFWTVTASVVALLIAILHLLGVSPK